MNMNSGDDDKIMWNVIIVSVCGLLIGFATGGVLALLGASCWTFISGIFYGIAIIKITSKVRDYYMTKRGDPTWA